MVSEKNKEVTENGKARKIAAAAIFRGKSTNNRRICKIRSCVQSWTVSKDNSQRWRE